MTFDQHEYDVRCEWGLAGLRACLPGSVAVVIVDVLSFATCVDIAVGGGALVLPYPYGDESAADYASSRDALLAGPRAPGALSLSPHSLLSLPAATRLVLPSPNGASLSLATGTIPTLAGCLRNARAVAQAASRLGGPVTVIPAGERWPDGGLRPALEDWLGAGAIVHHVPGRRSPEATGAEAAFVACEQDLLAYLTNCGSGRELIQRGFAEDVALAAALNVSGTAPYLRDGIFSAAEAAEEG